MILDQNDPTGLGLFSRCARNQACKTTKSRPQTAGSRKQSKSQLKIQQSKRKNTINDWFSRQQSRDQRQRKYKRQMTPSVGQYNPTIKQRPKLVWDVIKIYQKKNKQMKKLQQIKQKISKKQQTINLNKSLSKQKTRQNQPTSQSNIQYTNANTVSNTNVKFNSLNNQNNQQQQTILNQRSFSHLQSKNRYNTSISHKSSCMVNMSRMTGRATGFSHLGHNSTLLDQSNQLFQMTQLNKSIQKVKPKITKNFYFKKMIGRKDADQSIGTANIYDCKIDLIKPRKSAQLNFGISKGRQQSPKKADHSVYSYTHYDYNEYVWKSTSSVFANTKKNLIAFDKQR